MLVTAPMDAAHLVTVVSNAVRGGVNAVQLRDRTLSSQELPKRLAMLAPYLGGMPLIVNGDLVAAGSAASSGIHLPERQDGIELARLAIGEHRLIGRSVHSVEAAVAAWREGADYLIAGTVFASQSHAANEAAGLPFLREVCRAVPVPVLAIGGVTPENCGDCMSAGAAGIAVLSYILYSSDPLGAARRYLSGLRPITR